MWRAREREQDTHTFAEREREREEEQDTHTFAPPVLLKHKIHRRPDIGSKCALPALFVEANRGQGSMQKVFPSTKGGYVCCLVYEKIFFFFY